MYRIFISLWVWLLLVCCLSAQAEDKAATTGNTTDLRWPVDAKMSTVLVTVHPEIPVKPKRKQRPKWQVKLRSFSNFWSPTLQVASKIFQLVTAVRVK